jgi:hypothetical protein
MVTPEEAAVLATVFAEDGELPARPAGTSVSALSVEFESDLRGIYGRSRTAPTRCARDLHRLLDTELGPTVDPFTLHIYAALAQQERRSADRGQSWGPYSTRAMQ